MQNSVSVGRTFMRARNGNSTLSAVVIVAGILILTGLLLTMNVSKTAPLSNGNVPQMNPVDGSPPCDSTGWFPPNITNLTLTDHPSPGVSSPLVPGLTTYSSLNAALAPQAPLTLAVNSSGTAYGLFRNGTGYSLDVSDDLAGWHSVSNTVVPESYQVFPGEDLALTRG